jgi:hypothetical protein
MDGQGERTAEAEAVEVMAFVCLGSPSGQVVRGRKK